MHARCNCMYINFDRRVCYRDGIDKLQSDLNIPESELTALFLVYNATRGENWFWRDSELGQKWECKSLC